MNKNNLKLKTKSKKKIDKKQIKNLKNKNK